MRQNQAPALVGHAIPFPMQRFAGLATGQLHEIHAQSEDWAAALTFALAPIAAAKENGMGAPILLVRGQRGAPLPMTLCGEGLSELGIDPARLLIAEARDGLDLLRAGHEGARCSALAAVVLETWGAFADYGLTASRRLVLAAEASRVPILVLRGAAPPRASAAHTRWLIHCAPATPLAANAPGATTITAELQRQRGGAAGLRWQLIWDEMHGCFRQSPAPTKPAAVNPPVSGAVVSLPALRTGDAARRAA